MPTTFTNQATLSYNNQSIPSNVVTGVLTEVLSVSKTGRYDHLRRAACQFRYGGADGFDADG